MSAFFGVSGLLVFAFGLIKLIVGLFKKSVSKKQSLLIIIIGFTLFVIGVAIPSPPKKEAKTEATKIEINKETPASSSKEATKETVESSSEKEESNSEVFNIGDTVDVNGYQIKVNDIKYSDSEGYSTPDEGKQFVIINITITNGTKKKVSFNPLDFSLNEDGVSSSAGFTYADGVDTLNSGDLDPGATVTGNLVAQAKPESKLKLRYEGNFFLQNEEVDINLR